MLWSKYTDEGNVGIGFAVAINTVKALLPQLHQGRVHRARLRPSRTVCAAHRIEGWDYL
jgi:S1-C subfamily serine protease